MRTNTLLSVTLLAAAAVITSCRKEETPVKPAPEEGITFTASIGGSYTKTTLADENKVCWSDGDCISINGVRFVGTPKAAAPTKADFVKAEAKELPEGKYYAFFPADIQVTGQYGSLPEVQIYSEGRFDNVPMYACSESNNLEFHNICGVLAVGVPYGAIDQVASIRVSSTDEAMSGEFEVVGDTVATLTDEAKNAMCNVVLRCVEPVSIGSQGETFYIAIPAQKYTDINIEISSDGETYRKGMLTRNTDSIVVKNNEIYSVTFRADDPTANCYYVAGAGTDSIKTVKGCSSELVGRVKSAKVLWESYGTSTAPDSGAIIKSVSYSRGFIKYQTTGEKEGGNAVIAALDSAGKILWSWHIWYQKTGRYEEQKYYNNAGILMDRNLGATGTNSAMSGTVSSLGLLYQWGRKDPFLGSSAIDASTLAVSTPGFAEQRIGPVSIDSTIANPTSFVTLSYGGSGLWTLDPRAYWDSEKTIFDPCPVGWRVPDGGPYGVWNVASASRTVPVFNDEHKGYDCLGYFTNILGECWYPTAGYRNDDSAIKGVGETGRYWSCTGVPLMPIMLYGLGFDKNSINCKGFYDYPVKAMSIRCQKMEDEEE